MKVAQNFYHTNRPSYHGLDFFQENNPYLINAFSDTLSVLHKGCFPVVEHEVKRKYIT